MSSFGGTVKLTGESEYRAALKEISSNLKVLNSEMKAVTSEYDRNDKSVSNLSAQNDVLNRKIEEQENKVSILKDALTKAKDETGENSETTKKWQTELNNAQADLNKLNRSLDENAQNLKEAEEAEKALQDANKITIKNMSDLAAEMLKSVAGASNLGQTIKNDLSVRVGELKDKVKDGVDSIKTFGDVATHPKKLGEVIKEKLIDTADKLTSSTKEEADALEEFGNEADKSGEKALSLGDIIKANLISDAIKAGLSALVDGFKAIGGAVSDCLQSGAAYADNLLTLSAQTGLSTDTLEKYNAVAELTDVSMDTLTNSMAKNIKSMSDARDGSKAYAEAYKKLGVEITNADGSLRDSETVYWETIDALKGITDETERDAMAMEIFGKKAQDLNTIIEMGSEGVAEYTDMAGSMGAVLGGEGLAALGALDDQMQIFSATTDATKNIIASAFAPSITSAMEGVNALGGAFNGLVAAVISGEGVDEAFYLVSEGLSDLIAGIEEALPMVLTVVGDLFNMLIDLIAEYLPWLIEEGAAMLTSLLSGISQNLGTVMETVLSVVQTLLNTILQNLPMIIQMGIQMLTSLIQGIADCLPELIPVMIEAVVLVVETLLDNLDMLIESGIELILALADGLIEALPDLVDKIPIIIDKLVLTITNNLPKILQAGVTILVKVGEGLVKAIPQLIANIPQIITSLVNGFKSAWGTISSIGTDLVRGIWYGIDDATGWIISQIRSFGSAVLSGIKSIFGIHSPSTVFKEEVGKNLALGVGEGFADTMSEVSDEMQSAIPTEFDASVTTNVAANGQGTTYDMMVGAFKKALSEVKVVLDDREMGGFITDTVERTVFV